MLLLSNIGKGVHCFNAMLNLSHNLSGPGPPLMQLALLSCRKFHSGIGFIFKFINYTHTNKVIVIRLYQKYIVLTTLKKNVCDCVIL